MRSDQAAEQDGVAVAGRHSNRWLLFRIDRRPERFDESTLLVGLSAAAMKPG